MTATRDRHSDLDDDRAEPAWDERPVLGRSRGLPWWGAVLLAVGLAVVGAVVDMQARDTLGTVYQVAYVVGCVAAVCLVRRRNLFGPVVQPPLVFALVSIAANVVLGAGASDGLKGLLFSVALPLTSNFPTMAITTGVVLAIGAARFFLQRDPDAAKRPRGDDEDAPPRKPRPGEPARKPREDAPRRERPATPREEKAKAKPARRPARDEDRRPDRKPARKPGRDEDRKPPRRPRPER